jgi:Methyltransferase domain
MFTVRRLIIYIGKLLGRKSQGEIFDRNTSFAKNIVPADTKLCFSFIDGNHDPEYVKSDFSLAWGSTVPGGIVAFHDSQTGSCRT